MVEDRAFRLVKEIPRLYLEFQSSPGNEWVIDSSYESGSWQKLTSTNAFLFRDEIDLHGITKQELTMFFASNYTQRPFPYITGFAVDPTFGGLEVFDQMIVSDVPLADPTWPSQTSMQAGFQSTEDDYGTIKLAEGVIFCQTINAPNTMVMTDSYSFSSGDPTATNKLYLYRWIVVTTAPAPAPPPADGVTTWIPAKRYVATGITTAEPDLVHIMRLKRSFDMAGPFS